MDRVRELDLGYRDLFSAPDREGAVVSVRVHRKVKAVLEDLAGREGLSGVSELVRYLIAGYLLGKYGIERPKERVLVEPIVLNVNVQRGPALGEDVEQAVEAVREVIRDVEDYLRKLRAGLVARNPEVASRLAKRVARAVKEARRLGLEEEYARLLRLKAQLAAVEHNV